MSDPVYIEIVLKINASNIDSDNSYLALVGTMDLFSQLKLDEEQVHRVINTLSTFYNK